MSARLDRLGEGAGLGNNKVAPDDHRTSDELPEVSDHLLQHLTQQFPDKLPPEGTSYEDLLKLQGEQRVIAYLRSVQEFIEQNRKENTHVLRR